MRAHEAGLSLNFSLIQGIHDGESLAVGSLHRHLEFHDPAYRRIERLHFPPLG